MESRTDESAPESAAPLAPGGQHRPAGPRPDTVLDEAAREREAEAVETSRDEEREDAPANEADDTGTETETDDEDANANADGAASDGQLTFDHSIVTEIAHREAQNIRGIVDLSGSFMDGWMKSKSKGIRVEEHGEDAYTLRLNVIVEYGTDCVQLARTARARIGRAIRHMTGRETRRIDIHIAGIKNRATRDESHDALDSIGEEHGIDF